MATLNKSVQHPSRSVFTGDPKVDLEQYGDRLAQLEKRIQDGELCSNSIDRRKALWADILESSADGKLLSQKYGVYVNLYEPYVEQDDKFGIVKMLYKGDFYEPLQNSFSASVHIPGAGHDSELKSVSKQGSFVPAAANKSLSVSSVRSFSKENTSGLSSQRTENAAPVCVASRAAADAERIGAFISDAHDLEEDTVSL